MEKEKLYRIKPEARKYFLAILRHDKRTRVGWWHMGVDESALEEVDDSPKITGIERTSSYLAMDGGCTMTFTIIFDGYMADRWKVEQRVFVENGIKDIICPLLLGKTWDELAEKGGKVKKELDNINN